MTPCDLPAAVHEHGHMHACPDCGALTGDPCTISTSRSPHMCCHACWHDQKDPR